jgi:type IV pilus assembly protein PilX
MKRTSFIVRARQGGVSLLFALLALAAMSLAAVALVRSVDSGSLVIGNLAFKQDTTRAADRAAEHARGVLTGTGMVLTANGTAGSGYYATVQSTLDPTGQSTASSATVGVDWDGSGSCNCHGAACATCLTPGTAPAIGSVNARYVITRLCPNTGVASDTTNQCAQPATFAADNIGDKGGLCYGSCEAPTVPVTQKPYYRIVVRTVGARNTVSFTETIVY